MAFDAGALVSKLKLDTTGFNQSATAAQTKAGGLGKSMGSAGASFKKAGMAMTAAGGAILASLGLMMKKTAAAGDEIHKMSLRTGISAIALSELKHAAEISGASLGDVEKGIKKMSKSMVDADGGLATYLRSFERIGISMEQLKGLKPEEQMLLIGEAIAGLASESEKAATAQEIFGRAGTTLLPLFKEGAAGIEKLREEAHKLGVVFDQEAAAKAAALVDAQTRLKASMTGISQNIALSLMPMLTKLVEGIAKTVSKVSTWIKENPKLAETILKIVAGLGAFMTILGPILMMLPGIVIAIGAMTASIALATGAIGIIVIALVKYIGLLGKLKSAKEEARKADERNVIQMEKLRAKLMEMKEAAGMTSEEFVELSAKYEGNKIAMLHAIATGKEGVKMQEALAKVGGEHAAVIEDQREAQEKAAAETSNLADVLAGKLEPAIKGVTEKTKTWIDYISTLGLSSVKEKKERVDELTNYLKELEDAYADGKIGLEEFTTATAAARKEIENLSTEIDTTAIPAARDFSDVVGQAVTDIEEDATGFVRTFPTKISEGISFLTTFSERIRDQFATNLASMLSGAKSFKDVLGAVWGSAKEQFFTFVAQMVTKWLFGFVAKVVGGLGGLGSKIAGAFGGAGTALTGAATGAGTGGLFGNILGGIGKLAGPLGIGLLIGKMIGFENIANTVKGVWIAVSDNVIASIKAIGKVADSVLGAVSDVISGIGKAIGGALTGLGNLLSGANKKDKAVTDLLTPMRWNIKEIRDLLFIDFRQILLRDNVVRFDMMKDRLNQIKDVLYNEIRSIMRRILERMNMGANRDIKVISVLAEIRSASREAVNRLDKVVSLLKNIPKSAEGRVFNKPALTWIAESEPEAAVPLSKAGQFGGKNVTFQMNMNPTVQLIGTITGAGFDPTALQKQIRDGIVPQILRDLMSNLKKSEWQKALGLI